MSVKISTTLNGQPVSAEVPANQLLVHFIRETQGLTGTHVGCDTSQCGACTVHVDGRAVKSCTMLAAQADGVKITTIEGLAQNGSLHPMQKAFQEHHGLQCGFCTPGMIMAGVGIVERHGDKVTEDQVRHNLDGNLCRCTGYENIVKAIAAASAEMSGKGTDHV